MSRSLSSGKVQRNIQENKKIKEWIIKIAVIISGSMIAAYGMTLAIHAGYGGATLAILWVGVSKVDRHEHLYGIFCDRCLYDCICIFL